MKKLIYTLILICIAAGFYFTISNGKMVTAYFGGGNKKAKTEPGLQWKTNGLSLKYGPAVSFDGNIYAGKQNSFYCFSNSGSLLWEYTSGDLLDAKPVIGKDSGIYSFSVSSIVKFSKDGKVLWKIDAPLGDQWGPDPLVTEKGILVTRQTGGARRVEYKDFKVILIEPKGYDTEVMAFGEKIKPSGLLPLIIVGKKDTNLVLEHGRQLLVASPKGEILWQTEVQEKPIHFSMDSSGDVVVVSSKDEVRAYKIGGEQLWYKIFAGSIVRELKVRDTAEIIVNNNNLELVALSLKDGKEIWKYNPNIYIDRLVSVFESKLVMDKNKDIFLFYNNGELLKLHNGGEIKGQWKVHETKISPNTSIADDGTIYVLDEENNLCAIKTEAESGKKK
jgi:outer membrane protein assembly factor BamB